MVENKNKNKIEKGILAFLSWLPCIALLSFIFWLLISFGLFIPLLVLLLEVAGGIGVIFFYLHLVEYIKHDKPIKKRIILWVCLLLSILLLVGIPILSFLFS